MNKIKIYQTLYFIIITIKSNFINPLQITNPNIYSDNLDESNQLDIEGNQLLNFLIKHTFYQNFDKNFEIHSEWKLLTLSSECKSDLISLSVGLTLSKSWALHMIDSWGKIPAGILEGNLFALGSFYECMDLAHKWKHLRNSSNDNWGPFGKMPKSPPSYCLVDIDVGNPLLANATINYIKARNRDIIPLILKLPGMYYYQSWCLPDSCSPNDIYNLNNLLLQWLTKSKYYKFINAPFIARVQCTDINNTLITWPINLVHNSYTESNEEYNKDSKPIPTIPPISPIIYDPGSLKKLFIAQKWKDHLLAYLFFGFFISFILIAFLLDLIISSKNLSNTDHVTTNEGSNFVTKAKTHVTTMAQSLSPLHNFPSLFWVDYSYYDCLPIPQEISPESIESHYYYHSPIIPGLRALSLLWIIYANSVVLGTPYLSDPIRASLSFPNFISLSLNGALFAVDTFYFLSGLCSAPALLYWTYHRSSSSNCLSRLLGIFALYTYRYVRFTLPYMAVILYTVWLLPSFSSHSSTLPDLSQGCRSRWWTNMIYLNNFNGPAWAKCLPWTWYVANEAQFFILAPVLATLYARSRALGMTLIIHALIASVSAAFALSFVNRYRSIFSVNDPQLFPYFYDYYIRPYIRLPAYLVGLSFGLILYCSHQRRRDNQSSHVLDLESEEGDYNEDGDDIPTEDGADTSGILHRGVRNISSRASLHIRRTGKKMSRKSAKLLQDPLKRAVLWCVLIALVLAMIYGVKPETRSLTPFGSSLSQADATNTIASYNGSHTNRGFSPLLSAFYNSMTRPVWVLFLIWVIVSCRERYATPGGKQRTGLVASILSARVWLPLSNLAFPAYLIHPLVILCYYSSLNQPLNFSHPHLFMLFLGFAFVTFAISALVSLIFELPIINTTRLYVRRLQERE